MWEAQWTSVFRASIRGWWQRMLARSLTWAWDGIRDRVSSISIPGSSRFTGSVEHDEAAVDGTARWIARALRNETLLGTPPTMLPGILPVRGTTSLFMYVRTLVRPAGTAMRIIIIGIGIAATGHCGCSTVHGSARTG